MDSQSVNRIEDAVTPSRRGGGGITLLDDSELGNLKRRQRWGSFLKWITFVPVILGVSLILFVFASNINSAFTWQKVIPDVGTGRGESSGLIFDQDNIGNRQIAFTLDLIGQGRSAEEVSEILGDPEEMRIKLLRHRVDYLPWANGEQNQVIVWGSGDDLEEQYGFLHGRLNRDELWAEAQTEGMSFYFNPLLDWQFLQRGNSRSPQMTGFYNAIMGTLWVVGLVTIFSTIVGVSSAIYLEEYAPRNWFSAFLEVNLRNLAGVPSVVYGILGLYVFVRAFGFGRSVIAAAMTLTLLILPVVIIASREAIRAVPDSLRQASYGLGATKWQTVSRVVLPNAIPGIVTGSILAIARAIGDTASILVVGGAGFISSVPGGWDALTDTFTAMPLQIYSYYSQPNRDAFLPVASAGILVVLSILIIFYIAAFIIRTRYAVSR
ncbi:MAG: phosphate ABC transporter permease PstA [Deinococcota bacterium]